MIYPINLLNFDENPLELAPHPFLGGAWAVGPSLRSSKRPAPARGTYPLVNVYSLLWKDPPFFMGKSTINCLIFNSYVS